MARRCAGTFKEGLNAYMYAINSRFHELALCIGLLRVSEYSNIRGSEYKIEYENSSLPKSLDRDLFFFFFFLPFLLLKQEVFHKMVH